MAAKRPVAKCLPAAVGPRNVNQRPAANSHPWTEFDKMDGDNCAATGHGEKHEHEADGDYTKDTSTITQAHRYAFDKALTGGSRSKEFVEYHNQLRTEKEPGTQRKLLRW